MEGASEPEVDFTKLPIDERCQHKNWKARVSGYEDLAKVFQQADDEKAPEFTKYLTIVKKIPVDSNAAAQEKGLSSLAIFIENASPAISGRIAGDVMSGIINKCLISPKVKTRETANIVVLLYIEVEKQEIVMEELVKGLDNKSPKVVSACITLMKEAMNAFGPRVIKPGPLIKIVQSKVEDRDKTVRDETKQLAIALFRWLKEAFKPQLSGLKPVQLSELETEFAKLKDEKAAVTRYLRSEQVRVREVVNGEGSEVDGNTVSAPPPSEDIDPYELLEPVDILPKLPGDFFQLCESKKWQERKQALEALQELLTPNPKIASGEYGELVKTLKKFIGKDTNVVVVALAAKCLADLAARLRKGFSQYAHSCVVVILEKFKEKKQAVVSALREAVDAVMLSTTLEIIMEDITTALDNKNPQIKAETGLFLKRQYAILTPTVAGNKKLLKPLMISLTKTLSDMDGSVRDATAEAIGTAMKVNGEKLMLPFLSDVDPIKMAKIKEYYEKAEVKYPAPAGGHPPPRAAAPPTKTQSASNIGIRAPSASSSRGSVDDLAGDRVKKPVTPSKTAKGKPGMKKFESAPAGVGKQQGVAKPKVIASGKANAQRSRTGSATSIPAAAAKDEKVSTSTGVLPLNSMKETRLADEKALRVLKWNFTTPRDEFYVQLKEQMQAAGWSDALVFNCFHVDFKYHLKAITEMLEFLKAGNTEATLANSDIILKWLAIRFFDTNPSVILRGLDYVVELFTAYREANEKLIEPEAHSFFPYLILKAGDPKDAVRQKVHDIIDRARGIFPPDRLFQLIMNGLATKNSRQRATCLDELAILIELCGLEVCQPPHPAALKEIAKQIADRDNGVRNAALNCVVQIYFIEGERIYKQVGKLTEKDMSMLEERIKRMSKNRPLPKAPQVAASVPSGIRQPSASSNPSLLPALSRATPPKERTPPKVEERTPSPEETEDDIRSQLQGTHSVKKRADVTRSATITKRRSLVRPISMNIQELEQQVQDELQSPVSRPIEDIVVEPMSIRQAMAKARIAKLAKLQQQQSMPQHAESVEELLNLPDVQLPERRTSSNFVPSTGISTPGSVSKMVALSPKADVALNMVLAQLASNEIPKTIEAFAQLRELFDKPEKCEQFLSAKVDQIILMCNMQYRMCLGKHLMDINVPRSQAIDLFKSITSILDHIFKHPVLQKIATRDTLRELMPHVINIILEQRLTDSTEGSAVIKAVNMLATTILVHSDPTNMISALIKLLSDSVGGSTANPGGKFTEMVMKCIWKMVRLIDQFVGGLNIDQILFDIHSFMVEFPSDYWKSDPNRSDTPQRTIKTVTFLLVQHRGPAIHDNLSLIRDKNSSELYQYILRALKQIAKSAPSAAAVNSEQVAPALNGSDHNSSTESEQRKSPVRSGAVPTTQESGLSEKDSAELAAILDQLGSSGTGPGFNKLANFIHKNPAFDIEVYLLNSVSEYLRSFILEGLAKIDGQREPADQLPSSTPKANGSKVAEPVFSDVTPRLPSRSKLAPISGNTSIPRPSPSRLRAAQAIPKLPSAEQMTKEDTIEWLKACTALLGKDPAKFNDPEVVENMMKSVNEKYQFTNDPEKDMHIAERMVEDAQDTLRAFKKRFNINSN
ncbi:Cytoskeleton-associated protein 5 [Halotydeus destructor]|nr:Cytoskeleton-associated protein 5 [Halotydeus destructor]